MHGIKIEKEHISGMVYVQKTNYPNTNIRHSHNTYTILGSQPHTNRRAQPNIKYKYKYNQIWNKLQVNPTKRRNPKRGEDTRLNL